MIRPLLPRRLVLGGMALLGAGLGLPLGRPRAATLIQVRKQRGCGCCDGWVEHLRANGFICEVSTLDDLAPIKASLSVPEALRSCHTATVEGYVVEGHVPASALRRLLAERPAIRGLAVPGMPLGSPGMPGEPVDEYAVIAFAKDGTQRTFMRFSGERETI